MLLACTLLTIIAGIRSTCTTSGLHITLGDFFELSEDFDPPTAASHMLTVGLITDCQDLPVLEYLAASVNNSQASMPRGSVVMEASETRKIDIETEDGRYTRTAGFYFITLDIIGRSSVWRIKSENGSEWVGWPVGLGSKIKADLKLAAVGDMDISPSGQKSLEFMIKGNFIWPNIDMFVHLGDLSYNLEDERGLRGDRFFDALSPITKNTPYIVVKGNNDAFLDGKMFDFRFRMPGSSNTKWSNSFYDFHYQGVYFMVVDWHYLLVTHPEEFSSIFTWVSNKLKLAESRADFTWKVILSHKPIFCNDPLHTIDCTLNQYYLKSMDDLIMKYNVDLYLNAHLHEYARFKPMFNYEILPDVNYVIPSLSDGLHRSPVQVTSGNAGSRFNINHSYYDYMTPFVAVLNIEKHGILQVNFSASSIDGDALDAANPGSLIDHWSRTKVYNTRHGLGTTISFIILAVVGVAILVPYLFDLCKTWVNERKEDNIGNKKPILMITPDRGDNYRSIELDTLKAPSPPKEIFIRKPNYLNPSWEPKLLPAD